MRFFADENVARALIVWARGNGHDVLYAAEGAGGVDDATWLAEAEQSERVILTADKDFGELIFRDHLNSHGVVLLRLEDLAVPERVARLQTVWSVIEANPKGKFIVVTAKKVRVRPLATGDSQGEQ
jgi:predicted nuclease of predicted toxin-antitoxin system